MGGEREQKEKKKKLTICAGVVRLDVDGLDLALLDDESVALGARVAEDGNGVEAEV
jgi:hypothetical protein